jgi:uncharacterized protein YjdB
VNEGLDRLSFFAYAPHVAGNQITGFVTNNAENGIVAMNRNGAFGDPFIYYKVDFNPDNQVDFCWGTPQVNLTKPAVNQKVEFEFNHTLASLNVQIDAAIDALVPGNQGTDNETRIFVRSVSFEGFADQGAFNLNTPADKLIWYDITGTNYIEGDKLVIHDGRTNGSEGAVAAVNELPQGLNPVIVQSASYDDAALQTGVTNNAVNLFNSTTPEAPIYVIPTGQPLKVTIVYDVETQVDNLPGLLSDGKTHGSSIENNITKTITLNTGNLRLEAGKKYTLNLHLGLSSLRFDANVADWGDSSSISGDLPVNTTEPTVAVTGVTLDKTSLKLASTTTGFYTLTATVSPNNATNQAINWTVTPGGIATVDSDGKVTATAPGTATINATTVDGSFTETCTVEVVPTTLAALKLTVSELSDAEMATYKALDVDSDGNINVSDPQDEIIGKEYDSTKKIGFIAYIDPDYDVDTSVSGSRILVLAKENVSDTKYQWSSNNSSNGCVVDNVETSNPPLNGYAATNAMDNDSFKAKIALDTWANNVLKPADSSDWFIPSIGQWKVMNLWQGLSSLDSSAILYFSSSESNNDPGYTIWTFGKPLTSPNTFYDLSNKQDVLYNTRAVFVF